jgi:hypothetical protein
MVNNAEPPRTRGQRRRSPSPLPLKDPHESRGID